MRWILIRERLLLAISRRVVCHLISSPLLIRREFSSVRPLLYLDVNFGISRLLAYLSLRARVIEAHARRKLIYLLAPVLGRVLRVTFIACVDLLLRVVINVGEAAGIARVLLLPVLL